MRGRKTEGDWILRPSVPPLPLAREDEETFAFLLREDKKAFVRLLAELSRCVKEIEADAAKAALDILPSSEIKSALSDIADFCVERAY